ncbi:MAG: FAD-dependent oxidoreductase, partial [Ekhidna sp.]
TVFTNSTTYTARIALGAYGKRSVLDKNLDRDFSKKKQSWLAVKIHFRYPGFPENLVGLHTFKGGYAGLSKTESGAVNFCYLAHNNSFKKYGNIEAFNRQVVAQNPFLKKFLSDAQPIFEQPKTIAQISFDKKDVVVNHVLMCGDTAGLIHPLCGNGMAMAIHSAKIASEIVLRFLQDDKYTRPQLEQEYTKAWKKTFGKRLWFGRKLQGILLNESLVSIGIRSIGNSSSLLKYIISKTHGKLIS